MWQMFQGELFVMGVKWGKKADIREEIMRQKAKL